jgi:phasin family protein
MTDSTFDPKSVLDAYRTAFAPFFKAQQEAVKTLERASQYQYSLAGDYLELTLAQAKASVEAQSPTELVSKQVELATAFGEKMRGRIQEFVGMATDVANQVADATKTEVNKAADFTRSETAKKAA